MSEGMSEKLKACPFCGEAPEMFGNTTTSIRCSNEECISLPGPYNNYGHRLDAITAWNTRPAESALSVSREAWQKIIDADERLSGAMLNACEAVEADAGGGLMTSQAVVRASYNDLRIVLGALDRFKPNDAPQPTRNMLLTTPESANVGEWMPIETAPKDGTRVILWVPGVAMGEFIMSWWDGRWREPAQGLGLKPEPTHWRPLPAPPALTAREGV